MDKASLIKFPAFKFEKVRFIHNLKKFSIIFPTFNSLFTTCAVIAVQSSLNKSYTSVTVRIRFI